MFNLIISSLTIKTFRPFGFVSLVPHSFGAWGNPLNLSSLYLLHLFHVLFASVLKFYELRIKNLVLKNYTDEIRQARDSHERVCKICSISQR